MTTACKKCNIGKHSSKVCPITIRKKTRWSRRLAPHSDKKNFWDGVLTRSQLAGQMKEYNKIKKQLKDKEDEIKKIDDNSDICVICQDKCLEKEENSTPCGHVFHTGCLLGWLKKNNTCPCCRASLYDKPNIPDIGYIESIVETAIRAHLDVSPTDVENISINPSILYSVGDDIGRLVSEEILDIDLNWNIDDEEDVEDDDIENAETDIEDDGLDDDGLDDEDIEALLEDPEYATDGEEGMSIMDAIHNGDGTVNQEEKVADESHMLTPETTDLFAEFHYTEPQSMMDPKTTQFTEWFRFGGVIQELKSRISFKRAWNNIEEIHRQSVNNTIGIRV